jgi:protein O-mannose beta-1,4-N-acetylglucosaminyltransferase
MEGGGGKLAYSYGGVEPRKFGLGLVAGLLLVSCAYFSTVKLDAVHLVMSKQPFQPQACKNPFRVSDRVFSLSAELIREFDDPACSSFPTI